ncbi:hypothetical protein GQ53DRAFT_368814 [Thozetella sp. PMI_491]|nr:hypothetical protein GQ53DRAFT_368814 [Thozetella sp. PMI_491]
MDFLGGWMLNALSGVLPEQSVEFLHEHVLNPQSPVQGFRRAGERAFQSAYNTMWPILVPVFDRLAQAIYNSPDILVVVYFLGTIFLLLQTALWIHRFMMFWIKLIWRLFFWACVAALAAVVWQIGPEAATRQLVVIGSQVIGGISAMVAIFQQEYQKYDQQSKAYGGASHSKHSSSGRGAGWR